MFVAIFPESSRRKRWNDSSTDSLTQAFGTVFRCARGGSLVAPVVWRALGRRTHTPTLHVRLFFASVRASFHRFSAVFPSTRSKRVYSRAATFVSAACGLDEEKKCVRLTETCSAVRASTAESVKRNLSIGEWRR